MGAARRPVQARDRNRMEEGAAGRRAAVHIRGRVGRRLPERSARERRRLRVRRDLPRLFPQPELARAARGGRDPAHRRFPAVRDPGREGGRPVLQHPAARLRERAVLPEGRRGARGRDDAHAGARRARAMHVHERDPAGQARADGRHVRAHDERRALSGRRAQPHGRIPAAAAVERERPERRSARQPARADGDVELAERDSRAAGPVRSLGMVQRRRRARGDRLFGIDVGDERGGAARSRLQVPAAVGHAAAAALLRGRDRREHDDPRARHARARGATRERDRRIVDDGAKRRAGRQRRAAISVLRAAQRAAHARAALSALSEDGRAAGCARAGDVQDRCAVAQLARLDERADRAARARPITRAAAISTPRCRSPTIAARRPCARPSARRRAAGTASGPISLPRRPPGSRRAAATRARRQPRRNCRARSPPAPRPAIARSRDTGGARPRRGRAGSPAREARAAPESPRARSNAVAQRPRRNRPASRTRGMRPVRSAYEAEPSDSGRIRAAPTVDGRLGPARSRERALELRARA
ncbi:hypothetical protein BURPS1710b_A0058 [Burkholderia pseudomallei 1710b]|uniref:Uncharacterized protein n=1 Tax=Burkholderia pseudomallei (strain 1710b) TaxID=320372 RepID=Q3JMI7_BURP1|nr:hypothetical protein BURPS1710b_A0058 [Burkholderia pseudomallei 1710b]